MAETYRAQCRWAPDDYLEAHRVGDSVHVDACDEDGMKVCASLTPVDARAFARGILTLADETDGGEAQPNDAPAIAPSPLAPPTRLELLETARQLAPEADAHNLLRIATYLEGSGPS
ncbi:hypothetical protein ABZ128_09360 [Streptomyces sp. NPDC006326]|uniref:hypothetical protein n=1 Tax=Streptomyces sp. NPDC006326 TaxID=3156752 RepID=UPI0033B97F5E